MDVDNSQADSDLLNFEICCFGLSRMELSYNTVCSGDSSQSGSHLWELPREEGYR